MSKKYTSVLVGFDFGPVPMDSDICIVAERTLRGATKPVKTLHGKDARKIYDLLTKVAPEV